VVLARFIPLLFERLFVTRLGLHGPGPDPPMNPI
jgi:hypothetical protein